MWNRWHNSHINTSNDIPAQCPIDLTLCNPIFTASTLLRPQTEAWTRTDTQESVHARLLPNNSSSSHIDYEQPIGSDRSTTSSGSAQRHDSHSPPWSCAAPYPSPPSPRSGSSAASACTRLPPLQRLNHPSRSEGFGSAFSH